MHTECYLRRAWRAIPLFVDWSQSDGAGAMKTCLCSCCAVAAGHILGQSDACCACTIPLPSFGCYHSRVNRLSPTSCRLCEPCLIRSHTSYSNCVEAIGHSGLCRRRLSARFTRSNSIMSNRLVHRSLRRQHMWTAFARFVLFGRTHSECNVFVRVL